MYIKIFLKSFINACAADFTVSSFHSLFPE